MEKYKAKTANYEVFGVNMTVDISSDVNSVKYLSTCRSCQCQCHLCRGHRTPMDAGVLNKIETERTLEKLLAA